MKRPASTARESSKAKALRHRSISDALRKLASWTLVLMSIIAISANACATSAFTFDSGVQGWTNQAAEPFSVSYAAGQGFGGGGALAIAATVARDSYQIVHAEDADWPVTPSYFAVITFDVWLGSGARLDLAATGMQMRNSSNAESNVYLASSIIDLGGGWTRVFLSPGNAVDLPASHRDIGLNLHIGTTSAFGNSLVMVVDNIRGGDGSVPAPLAVPGLSTPSLAILTILCLVLALPRWRKVARR